MRVPVILKNYVPHVTVTGEALADGCRKMWGEGVISKEVHKMSSGNIVLLSYAIYGFSVKWLAW